MRPCVVSYIEGGVWFCFVALWEEGAVVGEREILQLLLRPERLGDLVEFAVILIGPLEVAVHRNGSIGS